MNTRAEFKALIESTLSRIGGDLQVSSQELSAYAAERAEHLATILENNEPGYEQAVIAARDNVALKAGLAVGDTASAVNREWLGIFAAALRFAAAALAA